jgi:hypothetical protein
VTSVFLNWPPTCTVWVDIIIISSSSKQQQQAAASKEEALGEGAEVAAEEAGRRARGLLHRALLDFLFKTECKWFSQPS